MMAQASVNVQNLSNDPETKMTNFRASGEWKGHAYNISGLFRFEGGQDRPANQAELAALLRSIADGL